MKISVVTVTRNAELTVGGTLMSVLSQRDVDVDVVVVDGASTDATVEIVSEIAGWHPGKVRWLSEPDGGIYNAINKGLALASGDVVGTLHAGDRFHGDNVLSAVDRAFSDRSTAFVYGDVCFVDALSRKPSRRKYCADRFAPRLLLGGFAPPHPSLYMRRELLDRVGVYKEDYSVAADFEYFVRLMLTHGERGRYLSLTMVDMATGGLSSHWRNRLWTNNIEKLRALRENNQPASPLRLLKRYFYL